METLPTVVTANANADNTDSNASAGAQFTPSKRNTIKTPKKRATPRSAIIVDKENQSNSVNDVDSIMITEAVAEEDEDEVFAGPMHPKELRIVSSDPKFARRKTLVLSHLTRDNDVEMKDLSVDKPMEQSDSAVNLDETSAVTQQQQPPIPLPTIIKIQSCIRRYLQRIRFRRLKEHCIRIQSLFRSNLQRNNYLETRKKIVCIQQWFRQRQARRLALAAKTAIEKKIISVQSLIRSRLQRNKYLKQRRHIVYVQKRYRQKLRERQRLQRKQEEQDRLHRAVKLIQGLWRRRLAAKRKIAQCVVVVQSVIRMRVARKLFLVRRDAVQTIQRWWRQKRVDIKNKAKITATEEVESESTKRKLEVEDEGQQLSKVPKLDSETVVSSASSIQTNIDENASTKPATDTATNISQLATLAEKRRALLEIRQKRLALETKLKQTSGTPSKAGSSLIPVVSTPSTKIPTPSSSSTVSSSASSLPVPSAAVSNTQIPVGTPMASRLRRPRTAASNAASTPAMDALIASRTSSTPINATSTQSIPRTPQPKLPLSAMELNRLTNLNTKRNKGHRCKLKLEVVQLPIPRPPSPTAIMMEAMEVKKKAQVGLLFDSSLPKILGIDEREKVRTERENVFLAKAGVLSGSNIGKGKKSVSAAASEKKAEPTISPVPANRRIKWGNVIIEDMGAPIIRPPPPSALPATTGPKLLMPKPRPGATLTGSFGGASSLQHRTELSELKSCLKRLPMDQDQTTEDIAMPIPQRPTSTSSSANEPFSSPQLKKIEVTVQRLLFEDDEDPTLIEHPAQSDYVSVAKKIVKPSQVKQFFQTSNVTEHHDPPGPHPQGITKVATTSATTTSTTPINRVAGGSQQNGNAKRKRNS